MIRRQLEEKLRKSTSQFPIVSLVGPRQSGKTTLVRNLFPDYQYISLEDPDHQLFAREDPRHFLDTYPERIILDEAQRVPELFSYLQTLTDQSNQTGQFILTGSQHFLMMESISQTLAGRTAIHTLLPFSLCEIGERYQESDYSEYIFTGGYPRIYDRQIPPQDFYPGYIQTYVERDVRNLRHVSDLHTFQLFLRLCAGRIGQLMNYSSLANDAGISHSTARAWISLLEASFIITLMQPYHRSFNKRLVKSPKLYFIDTGLAASLLGLENHEQLATHHMIGSLFENMVVAEYLKMRYNQGRRINSYFWRDKTGREIDLIIEQADHLISIEVKAGKTIQPDYFKSLQYWQELTGSIPENSHVIYGGEGGQQRGVASVHGWKQICDLYTRL